MSVRMTDDLRNFVQRRGAPLPYAQAVDQSAPMPPSSPAPQAPMPQEQAPTPPMPPEQPTPAMGVMPPKPEAPPLAPPPVESAPKDYAGIVGESLSGAGRALQGKEADPHWAQDRAAAEADQAKNPNSPSSRKAQAAAMPMLTRLGFSKEDMSGLSAADLQAGGGIHGLMSMVVKNRQEQAAAQAAQLKEDRDNKEWDRRNAVTAPQRLEASRQQGAMQLGNQQVMAGVNNALEGKRQEDTSARSLENQRTLAAEAEARNKAKTDEQRAYDLAHPKAGALGVPLKASDIEGTGFHVGDPDSAERIINKRNMTKGVIEGVTDAASSMQAIQKMIDNRKAGGSQAMGLDQGMQQDNALQRATAIANYRKVMGLPNTNEVSVEMDRLFPDPNAVSGAGLGGFVQGIAHGAGVSKQDPVLKQLLALKAEAEHNMTDKIGIPSLTWVGGSSSHHPGKQNPAPSDNLGGTSGAGPKVHGKPGKTGVRVQSPDGMHTGVFDGTAEEAVKAGLKVL